MIVTIDPADGGTDITIVGAADVQAGDGVTVRFPTKAAISCLEVDGELTSAIREHSDVDELVETALSYASDELIVVRSVEKSRHHLALAGALADAEDLEKAEDYYLAEVQKGASECSPDLPARESLTVTTR